jgi:serine/threonine-protein kinase
MFYRALTGTMPHAAANLHELLFKIVLEEPKPILELMPSADPEFSAIVMQGLRRDPDHRFLNPRAYQEAIAAWGRSQNNPLLAFEISDSVPPPIASGSTPMPELTPIAATQLSPPSPVHVRAQPSPVVTRTLIHESTPRPVLLGATAMATPAARANGVGTPVVWSDDAPRALASTPTSQPSSDPRAPNMGTPPGAPSPVTGRGQEGPTGTAPMAPPMRPTPLPPPPSVAPPRPAQASSMTIAVGIVIAAVVLGGAFVATRFVTAGGRTTATSASAEPAAPPSASVEPPPAPPSAAPELAPPPSASAAPEASAPAIPPTATSRPNRGTVPRVPAVTSAAASATAAPSASATTVNGRKVRTTLD